MKPTPNQMQVFFRKACPLVMAALFYTATLSAQKKDFLVSYTDTTSGQELYGYKSVAGKIIIPAKYTGIYTDTFFKMAMVLKDEKWTGIGRDDQVILTPYIYDNGPDYLQEGLFRFEENGMIGFANSDGRKVIAAQFSFAEPFLDGISSYTMGGERIYEGGKTVAQIKQENGSLEDRHWTWGGNKTESGFINKSGQRFRRVSDLKDNRRHAWTFKNKHVLLNEKGNIIKTFTK